MMPRPKARPGGPWLVSLVLHLSVGAGLVYVIGKGGRFDPWLVKQHQPTIPEERIGFLAVPRRSGISPGKSGGDGRPVRPDAPPRPPLVAPRVVPTGIPTPPPRPAAPEAGSGPVIGNGGPTAGLTPSLNTPRLWVTPESDLPAPPPRITKPTPEEMRQELTVRLQAHNDSLAIAQRGRKPGDWTVERGGKKYGIDQRNIYLGSITLPTALLALLPINRQANPTESGREWSLALMSADIHYQAERAITEDEFKAAVKRIRDRKERERREAEAQKTNAQVVP